MPRPELWIVAGPNGAGKTTVVQAHPLGDLLPRVKFFNPDDVARYLLVQKGYTGFADSPEQIQHGAFLAAADTVAVELQTAVGRGEAVGVETVLSTGKYRALVDLVRGRNGFVGLIYVALASPELACARVARRVRAGGHDVPLDKIRARWRRSLTNLAWFVSHVSAFWVFDNSDENPDLAPQLIATGKGGFIEFQAPTISESLRDALSSVPRRTLG